MNINSTMFSHSSVTEEYLREELVALYVALHDNISMFQQRTGADNQYMYMVLGALINEYKNKYREENDTAWR